MGTLAVMAPTEAPAERECVGYVAVTLDFVWHRNATCPVLLNTCRSAPILRADHAVAQTVPAADAGDLAHTQARENRSPCWQCAYSDILTDWGNSDERGYHYLRCTMWHDDGVARVGCLVCNALTRYANASDGVELATGKHNKVTLLRHGTLQGGGDVASIMSLRWENAEDGDLPPVTAAMWNTAATLIGGPHTLTEALTAVAGLHQLPVR